MRILSVVGAEITDRSIPNFKQMRHLSWLDIDNTRIMQKGFMELRKAFPEAYINYSSNE